MGRFARWAIGAIVERPFALPFSPLPRGMRFATLARRKGEVGATAGSLA